MVGEAEHHMSLRASWEPGDKRNPRVTVFLADMGNNTYQFLRKTTCADT